MTYKRRLGLGSLAALAAVAGSSTAAEAAALSAANRMFVDATVRQAMQSERLPGVTLTLSGPKGSYTRGYGVANTVSRAPMGLGLRVRIASITKTFTTPAVLLPVQRGRLSLSDKLSHWVKGILNGRLSSKSSTLTLAIFATLAQKPYPSSLKKK